MRSPPSRKAVCKRISSEFTWLKPPHRHHEPPTHALHMEPQTPVYSCVPSPFIGSGVTLTSSQQSQELVLFLLLSHMIAGFVHIPMQGIHAHTSPCQEQQGLQDLQVWGRCQLCADRHLWKLLGIAHDAYGWSSRFAFQMLNTLSS